MTQNPTLSLAQISEIEAFIRRSCYGFRKQNVVKQNIMIQMPQWLKDFLQENTWLHALGTTDVHGDAFDLQILYESPIVIHPFNTVVVGMIEPEVVPQGMIFSSEFLSIDRLLNVIS